MTSDDVTNAALATLTASSTPVTSTPVTTRRMTNAMGPSPILFIDRDGTLIEEPPDQQVDRLDKIKLCAGVIPALLQLRAAGYSLVMISNQDGLGTVSFPKLDFKIPHQWLLEMFASQGIIFDGIEICPHLPEDECGCRKPRLGLVSDYLRQNRVDFSQSYVIGDRKSDQYLAENMGLPGILYHPIQKDWPSIVAQLTQGHRRAQLERSTAETQVRVTVDLDQYRPSAITTGIGFFDHMLQQIAVHAGIGLTLELQGDLEIDDHHSVEDAALTLGQALYQALGPKQSIDRYGQVGFALPMDESRAQVLLDLSGRAHLRFDAIFQRAQVGSMATEMVEHFFKSLSDTLKCSLHIKAEGDNDHHCIEAIFKAFGRALRQAITLNSNVTSSKGVLM